MIKDSGQRTEFETGAVRDVQTGKGRCDLLPLHELANYAQYLGKEMVPSVLDNIYFFTQTGKVDFLFNALEWFCGLSDFDGFADMALEVSIHFEEGARKYAERNWEKGIPISRYVDSGLRHFLKFVRGDEDERHDRAFVWNVLCACWTVAHRPEMIDYPWKPKAPEGCAADDEGPDI